VRLKVLKALQSKQEVKEPRGAPSWERPMLLLGLILRSSALAVVPPASRCDETPPAYSELEVRIERVVEIFNETEAIHAPHGLGFALPDGTLQVTVGVNFQNPLVKKWVPACGPEFACVQSRSKRSTDGGIHWAMMPVNASTNRSVSEFDNYAFALPGTGEIIQFTGFQRGPVVPAPAPNRSGSAGQHTSAWAQVKMEMIRSLDGGLAQNVSVASVVAPAGLLRAGWISTSHSSIVALSTSPSSPVLLASAYAPWEGVDGYNEAARRSKTRVFVIRSFDEGRTWHYLSTVAWDPVNATVAEDHSADCEVNGMCDGFDEAALSVAGPIGFGTAASTVVCIMRSGGPLYRSVSIDFGATWSSPVVIAPHGVSPQAVHMNSGVLAVVYGRPDNCAYSHLPVSHTEKLPACAP
jgi:hypothetical protein